MAISKLQLNWTSVEFAATPITRVTACMFDQGGQLINFSGDNDRFPTVIANNVSNPKCSITSGDVATLLGIAPGTVGTIAATHADAMGVSLGGVEYALINAVHESAQDNGQWGQFGTGTATFNAFSSDGATNPLSFTRV